MNMWTLAFWKGAGERALATFLEAFIAALVVGVGAATTAWEVAWGSVIWGALGIAILATVLSVAKSLGNPGFTAGKANVITVVPEDTGYAEPAEPTPPANI